MKVVPSPPPSALSKLAGWFHQDFGLTFPGVDVLEGANIYFRQLSASQLRSLQIELATFLREHAEQPDGVLTRLWRKRGVEYWPRGVGTRTTLEAFQARLIDLLLAKRKGV